MDRREDPAVDARRDALACAALLLAMVISVACGAFVIEAEALAASPLSPAGRALCPARGLSLF